MNHQVQTLKKYVLMNIMKSNMWFFKSKVNETMKT